MVADTESKVRGLREKVVVALNTRDIATLTRTMKQVVTSGSSTVFGNIVPPPSLSPFFVGRREERRELLWILERHGALLLLSMAGQGRHS